MEIKPRAPPVRRRCRGSRRDNWLVRVGEDVTRGRRRDGGVGHRGGPRRGGSRGGGGRGGERRRGPVEAVWAPPDLLERAQQCRRRRVFQNRRQLLLLPPRLYGRQALP